MEKPKGVIVQFGGQTPLKLARDLEGFRGSNNWNYLRRNRRAEDRERFQQMINN